MIFVLGNRAPLVLIGNNGWFLEFPLIDVCVLLVSAYLITRPDSDETILRAINKTVVVTN